MIETSHRKYTREGWQHNELLPYESSFLPDVIIDRIVTAVTPYLRVAEKKHPMPWDAPLTQQTKFTIDDAINEVDHLINGLSPLFKDVVRKAQENNQLQITPVKGTNANGRCDENSTVFWDYDDTINNPIYLAHEFGHHIGLLTAEERTPYNITEWQSYFLHHAQYDQMPERHPQMATAIRQHQTLELMIGLRHYAEALKANAKTEDTRRVHYHASAMFVGLALYQQYQATTDETKREEMIKALFFDGENTEPEKILTTFGLLEDSKLETAIERSLRSINFSKAPILQSTLS